MAHDEYVYTVSAGWLTLDPQAHKLPAFIDDEDLWEHLYEAGYRILGQSGSGRCGLGHFEVWGTPEADGIWPRYALEIHQMDAAGVVWIADLPALWEFLRLYGQVGFAMASNLSYEQDEDDHEEDDDEDTDACDECGGLLDAAPSPRNARPQPFRPRIVPPRELN